MERLRGLRIGLLLEAGCGLAVEPEVRGRGRTRGALLERAGAVVAPLKPFMTQGMLDGMDHFWRMRSHVDMRALPPAAKASVLPYIRDWADSAARHDGRSGVPRRQPVPPDAAWRPSTPAARSTT